MTSKAGHTFTAGPWECYLRDRTGNPPFIMQKGETSGWVAQTCTWMGQDEAEANARLIAAAPDLLEALQEIDRLASRHEAGAMGKAQKIARAAIAKATAGGAASKLTDDEIIELTSREAALGPAKAGGA